MVDAAAVAAQVTATLAPLIPVLLGNVASGAGEALRDHAGELAEALWARLRPAVEARAGAKEAVEDVAAHPDDPDAQTVLRVQLRKLLESDPALHQAVADLLARDAAQRGSTTTVTASGERAVAIGGSNTGSITTGDQAGRGPGQR